MRRPPEGLTTAALLADAIARATEHAGLDVRDVDGLGISSFTLAPDHCADLAWRMGLRLSWSTDDATGGGGALNMLRNAIRAVEAGDARTIVLAAGGVSGTAATADLLANFNTATRDHLSPLPFHGPNALFALLTRRHMRAYDLDRRHYGAVAVAQRRHAERNPGAVYRTPLTLEAYLAAPVVADPLCLFDCVPGVTGADAIVVTARGRAQRPVGVRAVRTTLNCDPQESDGLRTGLAAIASSLWEHAGVGPESVDLVNVYDDYPVMVLIQLADLGFVPDGDVEGFVRTAIGGGRLPVNTSGGMLSAGQARGNAGMHGLVEAVTQLRGEAGERQVPSCRLAAVSGYGMVVYRHGAAASAAVLERLP